MRVRIVQACNEAEGRARLCQNARSIRGDYAARHDRPQLLERPYSAEHVLVLNDSNRYLIERHKKEKKEAYVCVKVREEPDRSELGDTLYELCQDGDTHSFPQREVYA